MLYGLWRYFNGDRSSSAAIEGDSGNMVDESTLRHGDSVGRDIFSAPPMRTASPTRFRLAAAMMTDRGLGMFTPTRAAPSTQWSGDDRVELGACGRVRSGPSTSEPAKLPPDAPVVVPLRASGEVNGEHNTGGGEQTCMKRGGQADNI